MNNPTSSNKVSINEKSVNPWMMAVNKTRLDNPDISYKEALILTKTSYVSKKQKKIMKKSKKSTINGRSTQEPQPDGVDNM